MIVQDTPAPVLIYRDHLLKFSEVWVRHQGEALSEFRPYYVGSKRFPDVALPEERVFTLGTGGLRGRVAEWAFKTMGFAPQLDAWARNLNPALIHAHFGLDGALMLPLARRLGLPLVVTFHGYDVMMKDEHASRSFYVHRKYLRERERVMRDGDLFIAVSHCIRDLLLEQGFPESRTVVHYIGVDIRFFSPDPTVRREPIVLFVGRLSPEKGCDYLIQAMAEVQTVCPDVGLVVIGDGAERVALERQAAQTLRNARFLGAQPQYVIRSWLNKAMVFAAPSLRLETGRGEAFGLVFAEAQAMGVPVVSFASYGVREAVADGETGFLLPERDWQGLAQRIIQLLTNSAAWTTLSNAGRQRTARMFDLAVQTRALEDLYREVMRERTVAQPQGVTEHRRGNPSAAVSLGR